MSNNTALAPSKTVSKPSEVESPIGENKTYLIDRLYFAFASYLFGILAFNFCQEAMLDLNSVGNSRRQSRPSSQGQKTPIDAGSGATNAMVTTTSTTTKSSTSKLRDSCQACAQSKVKCPKEKPTCSRCESRGITCQYFFTKRPGRRRENARTSSRRPSIASVVTVSESTRDVDNSTEGSGTTRGDEDTIHVFLEDVPPLDSSDVFSVLWDTTMYPDLSNFDTEVTNIDFSSATSAIDASPFGLSGLDNSNIDASNSAPASNDIESLLIPADKRGCERGSSKASSVVDLLSASSATSATSSSLASSIQALSTQKPGDPHQPAHQISICDCLVQGLDLLKMSSSTGTSFAEMDRDETNLAEWTQTVLAENKEVIETVDNIIACLSCADDGFLLIICSMIVLKMLGRYAAAANTQIGDMTSDGALRRTTSMSSTYKERMGVWGRKYHHIRDDNPNRTRMAARLVLGELHRVQNLVNQLSPRLKQHREEDGTSSRLSSQHSVWGQQPITASGNTLTPLTPFSSDTLSRMDIDMRKGLSTLSAQIINKLRHS